MALHQAGYQRFQGRALQAGEPGDRTGGHEQDPHVGVGEGGVGQERPRAQPQGRLAGQHQPAAVDGVGQGAAQEGRREEAGQLGGAQGADREGGAGEPERLVGNGHEGDHRAEERHRPAGHQEPEVAMPAQRPEVHGQGPPPRAALLSCRRRGGGLGWGRRQPLVWLHHVRRLRVVSRRLLGNAGAKRLSRR